MPVAAGVVVAQVLSQAYARAQHVPQVVVATCQAAVLAQPAANVRSSIPAVDVVDVAAIIVVHMAEEARVEFMAMAAVVVLTQLESLDQEAGVLVLVVAEVEAGAAVPPGQVDLVLNQGGGTAATV